MKSNRTPKVEIKEGAIICGWCDAFEKQAKLAVAALQRIAQAPCTRDDCCDDDHDPLCPIDMALVALGKVVKPTEVAGQEAML